jgi:hypothetical protein
MFACTLPAVLIFFGRTILLYIAFENKTKNACKKFHLLNAKYNVCIFQV